MTSATDAPTSSRQNSRNLTESEKERLLEDIAAKQLPQRVIAAQWGLSHQWVRQIASDNKERIADIRLSWDLKAGDESPVPLWVRDKLNRLALRQGALLKILEQQAALEAHAEWTVDGTDAPTVISDHWAKLETLKQQILRHIDEIEGQLPTRLPPEVEAVRAARYELVGVDKNKLLGLE